MSLLQAKQIKKIISGFITLSPKLVNSGTTSVNITAEIITLLTTAGFNGSALSNLESTNETLAGIITNTPYNFVDISLNPDLTKLSTITSSYKEVYGRITKVGADWIVTYYYFNTSGVETPYTLTDNYSFRLNIPYRFELKNLPSDFAIKYRSDNPNSSGGTGSNALLFTEVLTVSAPNIVSDLTYLPYLSSNITLNVNGEVLNHIGVTKPFSVIGKVITWDPVVAKFNLAISDKVVAQYLIQI